MSKKPVDNRVCRVAERENRNKKPLYLML